MHLTKMLKFLIQLIFTLSIFHCVSSADEFEDYRCRCVCPSFTVLQDPSMNDTHRRVYVDVVPAENCTCERVVFHTIPASKNFQQRFCPRCVCNYEVRNTTTMKIVVIIIMVAITLLFIYMSFLLCLDPIMSPKPKATRTATNNVNTSASTATTTTNSTRTGKHHERHVHDESQLDNPTQECVFSEPSPVTTAASTTAFQNQRQRSSNVLNLVSHEQSKWRKQVHQQRQAVYNKHELLN